MTQPGILPKLHAACDILHHARSVAVLQATTIDADTFTEPIQEDHKVDERYERRNGICYDDDLLDVDAHTGTF